MMPAKRKAGLSTKELYEQLGSPGFVILDVRRSAAYNGWPLRGEARGGHIPGAVNLPLSWTEGLSETDLRALLESKGIHADATIVVYGDGEDDSAAMVTLLRDVGCREVLAYDGGLPAWAADETLPMTRLPNYEQLVPPEWVYRLVRGRQHGAGAGRGFSLFEVGSREQGAYRQGHIPGAVYLDTNELESEPLWNRVPDGDLEAALLAHGVTHQTMVVLYGRDTTAAARTAVILMYAGVKDVRLLDGGFGAWTSAGYGVETKTQTPEPVHAFGQEIPAHPEYIIGIEKVRALLADEDAVLVSVRSWAEYTGQISGYDFVTPRGRIPGAVWGHAGSTPHQMDHLRNADNTMRSHHEIAEIWREWGTTPDKRIAFYCGTGWRASEAFFYAHLMGWDRISVYDGGWYEWSADPANPVESGGQKSLPGDIKVTHKE